MIEPKIPEGIIYSDLGHLCKPASAISEQRLLHMWEACPYETASIQGSMLVAFGQSTPPSVQLPLQARGWHKIFVSLLTDGAWATYTFLKLTDDPVETLFAPDHDQHGCWSKWEMFEEDFWKCADLTGQNLTISKRAGMDPHTSSVAWIRIVPMTEDEILGLQAENQRTSTRRLLASSDMDWHAVEMPQTDAEYMTFIDAFRNSDVEILSFEDYSSLQNYRMSRDEIQEMAYPYNQSAEKYQRRYDHVARLDDLYPKFIAYGHQLGLKMYISHRMGLSAFAFPNDIGYFDMPFFNEHSSLACKNRDGSTVDFLSYAYPETQEFMIGQFLRLARFGFDGISLILTRGIHVLFDEPVLAWFREKYDGQDMRLLPITDERVHGAFCEVMTRFIRQLRQRLDAFTAASQLPRLAINVYTHYRVYDSKLVGLDVETWAREGLIDSCVASNMRHTENLDGVWQDNHPDLIDLEKYTLKAKWSPTCIIERTYDFFKMDLETAIPEYMAIARKYPIKVYFETHWENSLPPAKSLTAARRIYALGAENLALWDAYPARVIRKQEWTLASRLGHKDELADFDSGEGTFWNLYRILSIKSRNISTYNPSWRG